MFTPDDSKRSYGVIQFAAKHFMDRCIHSRIPMRGAISVGSFMRTRDNRSFIGKAFLDAFEYAEDQDWIGLILTPTAIKKAESCDLVPVRHDFVRSQNIPMRKFSIEDVLAYRFQKGRANRPCSLLPMLRDMRMQSDEVFRPKYERTEQFIAEHYRWLKYPIRDIYCIDVWRWAVSRGGSLKSIGLGDGVPFRCDSVVPAEAGIQAHANSIATYVA